MSDVVVVPKLLLERLLETVECNDPRNEYLNATRIAIAENERLMASADVVMDRNHDETAGSFCVEFDRDNRRWVLMGDFDLDALKIMTMTLANPGISPGLSMCSDFQEGAIAEQNTLWDKLHPEPEPPSTLDKRNALKRILSLGGNEDD